MQENIITITNPLIFWDKSYIQKTLNTLCYGDENTVEVKIIAFNEMTKEIELKFIFPELALKFMKSYNNKPLDQLINHNLIIHLGPSDKSNMITPKKEAVYYENYTQWIDALYERKPKEEGLILINKLQIENQKKIMSYLLKNV